MKVSILGVGGSGSWLSILIALRLKDKDTLVLIDDDRLSDSNTLRVPFPKSRIGDKKVLVAKDFIRPLLAAGVEIEAIDGRFPTAEIVNTLSTSDIVFDCSDNSDTKRAVAETLPQSVYLIRVGADDKDIMVDARRADYWGEQDGYDIVTEPETVMVAAAKASMVCVSGQKVLIQEEVSLNGQKEKQAKAQGGRDGRRRRRGQGILSRQR